MDVLYILGLGDPNTNVLEVQLVIRLDVLILNVVLTLRMDEMPVLFIFVVHLTINKLNYIYTYNLISRHKMFD